jgi:tetratricopeptide (TPR) repeat protein
MSSFAELELNVSLRSPGEYLVQARFYDPQSATDNRFTKSAPFNADDLRQRTLDPEDYGHALSRHLFADQTIRELFVQARSVANARQIPLRVRLSIDESAEDVHNFRWETLTVPGDTESFLTLNQNFFFSRYLSGGGWQAVYRPPRNELQALVVIANPSNLEDYDLAPIKVEQEKHHITSSIQDKISVDIIASQGQATLETITQYFQNGDYHILYLVAHGDFRNDRPLLWLENEDGTAEVIDGTQLVKRFKYLHHRPLLVVLASCQSAGNGEGEALAALGPSLAEAGVPAVLAMQGNITQKTVSQFMPSFFKQLQQDGLIDRAVTVARGAVQAHDDWWMPVLFLRVTDGCLWEKNNESVALHNASLAETEGAPSSKEKPQTITSPANNQSSKANPDNHDQNNKTSSFTIGGRDINISFGNNFGLPFTAVIVVPIAILFFTLIMFNSIPTSPTIEPATLTIPIPPTIEPMTGTVNIAIAEFVGDEEMDDILEQKLKLSLSPLNISEEVKFRKIAQIHSKEEALEKAQQHAAHVVIWGWVQDDEIAPFFQMVDFQEGMVVPLTFSESVPASRDEALTEVLNRRSSIIAMFVKGLTHVFTEKYQAAAVDFQEAIDRVIEFGEGKDTWQVEGTLYLYLGRSFANIDTGNNYEEWQENLEKATDAFSHTLTLNNGYSWAHLYQGNIYYKRATDWEEDVDWVNHNLKLALNKYEHALELQRSERPVLGIGARPEAFVERKSLINIGRVCYELAIHHQDDEVALMYYTKKALAVYQEALQLQATRDLKAPDDLIVHAYQGMGRIYELQQENTLARDAYMHCLEIVPDNPTSSDIKQRCIDGIDRTGGVTDTTIKHSDAITSTTEADR